MKAIVISNYGDNSLVELKEIPLPRLKPTDLLIKVHAAAVNRLDLMQRAGVFKPPAQASAIMGIEAAGEVVEKGSAVQGIAVGDRVFGFVNGGAYADYCLMDYQMALPIPEEWDYRYAVAIPEAFITASERLFTNAKLQPQQTLLIHAGGSGVGTAAIQLAHFIQATVMITAGSELKIRQCLALGADLGINYKHEDFVKAVLDYTQDVGVEVILDSIGGDYLSRNMHALKPDGKLILMGALNGTKGQLDIIQLIYKRITIMANNLTRRDLASQREVNQRFKTNWLPLLIAKKINPVIDSIYPITAVAAAHQRMQDNLNFGKIILEICK